MAWNKLKLKKEMWSKCSSVSVINHTGRLQRSLMFCWVLLNTSFSLNVIHWHTWKYKILTLCVVDHIRHFYFFSKNLLLNKVTVYVSSHDKELILLLSYRLETHGLFLLFCLLVHNKRKHRHAPPPRSACVPRLATSTGEEKSGSRWDPGGVGSCTQCEAHGLVASTVPLLNLLMSLSSQPLLQQALHQEPHYLATLIKDDTWWSVYHVQWRFFANTHFDC